MPSCASCDSPAKWNASSPFTFGLLRAQKDPRLLPQLVDGVRSAGPQDALDKTDPPMQLVLRPSVNLLDGEHARIKVHQHVVDHPQQVIELRGHARPTGQAGPVLEPPRDRVVPASQFGLVVMEQLHNLIAVHDSTSFSPSTRNSVSSTASAIWKLSHGSSSTPSAGFGNRPARNRMKASASPSGDQSQEAGTTHLTRSSRVVPCCFASYATVMIAAPVNSFISIRLRSQDTASDLSGHARPCQLPG